MRNNPDPVGYPELYRMCLHTVTLSQPMLAGKGYYANVRRSARSGATGAGSGRVAL